MLTEKYLFAYYESEITCNKETANFLLDLENFYAVESQDITQAEILSYLLKAEKLKLHNEIKYLNSLYLKKQLANSH